MRRSFVRLVITSVLVCGAISLSVIALYGRSISWMEAKAGMNGIYLVHKLLDAVPAAHRQARLQELRPHFAFDLSLIPYDEAQRRVGRPMTPGEYVTRWTASDEASYILAFTDRDGALAVGPIDNTVPAGTLPIGGIIALVGIPLIAAFIALRVERELTKVERASDALAVGELSARVDNPSGPSKELAASFNAMAERIEHLIRSRDELVQAVSHELGSPLSRLRFHLVLLQDHPGEEREARISAMTRELDSLDDLVAELLGYVQSDELELHQETFDPQQILADLGELARLEIPEERTVAVDIVVPDGVAIGADKRLFQRAIENVLRNAVRYAEDRIMLEVTQTATHVRVAVNDDGPGIPEAMREKVMTPFFRLEPDRARKTGGVGLGLAIVSRIMHRHGGQLQIGTSSMGGATIATLWPRQN